MDYKRRVCVCVCYMCAVHIWSFTHTHTHSCVPSHVLSVALHYICKTFDSWDIDLRRSVHTLYMKMYSIFDVFVFVFVFIHKSNWLKLSTLTQTFNSIRINWPLSFLCLCPCLWPFSYYKEEVNQTPIDQSMRSLAHALTLPLTQSNSDYL